MLVDLHLVIAFLLGVASGVAGLAVLSNLIRKQIENGVKAEIAKLIGHATTIASAAAPKALAPVVEPVAAPAVAVQ